MTPYRLLPDHRADLLADLVAHPRPLGPALRLATCRPARFPRPAVSLLARGKPQLTDGADVVPAYLAQRDVRRGARPLARSCHDDQPPALGLERGAALPKQRHLSKAGSRRRPQAARSRAGILHGSAIALLADRLQPPHEHREHRRVQLAMLMPVTPLTVSWITSGDPNLDHR